MPQYVLYDPNTGKVRQFIDTERWNYHSETLSDLNSLSISQSIKFKDFNNKEKL